MALKMALLILGVLLFLTVASTEQNSLSTVLGLGKVGLDGLGDFIESTGKWTHFRFRKKNFPKYRKWTKIGKWFYCTWQIQFIRHKCSKLFHFSQSDKKIIQRGHWHTEEWFKTNGNKQHQRTWSTIQEVLFKRAYNTYFHFLIVLHFRVRVWPQ